nr:hypothetical protein OH820_15280 [Streptomyces sp. NBC_00857]
MPYISARQGEEPESASQLVVNGGRVGIQYRTETTGDRDLRGVLWARVSQNIENGKPTGAPRWSDVHPSRQRECMLYLKCQVCARPADRTNAGYLFLATAPAFPGFLSPGWAEGYETAQPPLCLADARKAVAQCPRLADSHVVLRAARVRLHGVIGMRYQHHPLRGVEQLPGQDREKPTAVPYGDPRTPWVLATQLVRRLYSVTVTDLDNTQPQATP